MPAKPVRFFNVGHHRLSAALGHMEITRLAKTQGVEKEDLMYHKIVVPLDGSELAECVLPHVQTLAQSCDVADVVLVRVAEPIQPIVADYALKQVDVANLDAEAKVEAEKYLAEVAKRTSLNGTRVETRVLSGFAAESIADFAKDFGADVIVLATHGRSGVKRWVWGSTADKILRSACMPVMMVRAPGCVPGF